MAFFMTNNILEAKDLNRPIEMKWELGYAATKEAKPEKWIPATVPGAVQLDIAKAEKYAPYYYAEHWKDYQWMEDNYYTYRSNFNKPELSANEKLYFISKGIDYQFEMKVPFGRIYQMSSKLVRFTLPFACQYIPGISNSSVSSYDFGEVPCGGIVDQNWKQLMMSTG